MPINTPLNSHEIFIKRSRHLRDGVKFLVYPTRIGTVPNGVHLPTKFTLFIDPRHKAINCTGLILLYTASDYANICSDTLQTILNVVKLILIIQVHAKNR